MLNISIPIFAIFLVCAIIMVFQEEQITIEAIIYAFLTVMVCVAIFGIDGIIRRVILKKRIQRLNKVLGIDCLAELSGRSLNDSLIYKDSDWFVAVPAPECIILNRKYIRDDIEIDDGAKNTELTVHTIDGKKITFRIDRKWKYVIIQFKKWMR